MTKHEHQKLAEENKPLKQIKQQQQEQIKQQKPIAQQQQQYLKKRRKNKIIHQLWCIHKRK